MVGQHADQLITLVSEKHALTIMFTRQGSKNDTVALISCCLAEWKLEKFCEFWIQSTAVRFEGNRVQPLKTAPVHVR